jgi:hypothetical protein
MTIKLVKVVRSSRLRRTGFADAPENPSQVKRQELGSRKFKYPLPHRLCQRLQAGASLTFGGQATTAVGDCKSCPRRSEAEGSVPPSRRSRRPAWLLYTTSHFECVAFKVPATTTMYEDSWYSFGDITATSIRPAQSNGPRHRRTESLLQQPNVRPYPPAPHASAKRHESN